MTKKLGETLDEFIGVTAKSKVAVVVPMYGYWSDALSDQLNAETLRVSLDRIYSSLHQVYIIFVADVPRLSQDLTSIIMGKTKGGNAKGVSVKTGSTYGDYLREGFNVALETDAQFIISVNPWVLLQHNALDILVDRINRDDAKIVSGYDFKGLIEAADFLDQKIQLPKEEHDFNVNFFGMKRYALELIGVDEHYKTHAFLGRDIWQSMFGQGFPVITSQRVPIFTFEVDWTEMENFQDFSSDEAYFVRKWKFNPGIKYGQN